MAQSTRLLCCASGTGGCKVMGIEPTNVYKLAIDKGIPTRKAFFTKEVAQDVRKEFGGARVVTATNVFAPPTPRFRAVQVTISALSSCSA